MGCRIVSDFKDYYDSKSDENSILTYNRFYSKCMGRGKELKKLNELGIKTVDIKPVHKFNVNETEKVVVYLDDKKHNFESKVIVDTEEAKLMYSNKLASQFYSNNLGVTYKFLQIGERRFRIKMERKDYNINKYKIDEGIVTGITEIPKEFNYLVKIPIFSIDYICDNNKETLAVDFNQVQNLGKLNLQEIISSDEVIKEIEKSILVYNLHIKGGCV